MVAVATGSDASGDATALQRRTYGDGCAVAHALDLIGERWALLIVRELLFGPKRFTDLQAGVPNARPNVLSQRLRELEQSKVIQRRRLGPPARAWVYELTDHGRDLEPVVVHLGRWGRHSPFLQHDGQVGVDSLMLALKSHFDPTKCQDFEATYLIAFDDDLFTARINGGRLTISRGEPHDPNVAIHTDTKTFRALIIERQRPSRARREGRLEMIGDADAFNRLLDAVT
jgi:DNA-binding HxlR family transcriptional regulator